MQKGLITTNGVFDVFHAGHVATLKYCRSLGSFVIVLLNSDRSVEKIRGAYPINNQDLRYQVLIACRYVDQVFIFDEHDPSVKILELKPEIHVKGGDYESKESGVGNRQLHTDLLEKEAVESYGGHIVIAPALTFSEDATGQVISSTYIRNQIYERELRRRGM